MPSSSLPAVGLDQLEYPSPYFDGRDPIAGLDWSTLVPQGTTARRPKSVTK